MQNFTVPPGTHQLWVILAGAAGGGAEGNSATDSSGAGGCVSTTIAVAPGQVLRILVGGQGSVNHRGYNGGGLPRGSGGGGGGASDIRTSINPINDLSTRLVVAGGGGGAHASWSYGGAGIFPLIYEDSVIPFLSLTVRIRQAVIS